MTHIAKAVCTCGDTWDIEVDRTPAVEMDARTAIMFSTNRGVDVRAYNEHVHLTHKRGRA